MVVAQMLVGFFLALERAVATCVFAPVPVGGGVNPLLFGGEDAVLQVVEAQWKRAPCGALVG